MRAKALRQMASGKLGQAPFIVAAALAAFVWADAGLAQTTPPPLRGAPEEEPPPPPGLIIEPMTVPSVGQAPQATPPLTISRPQVVARPTLPAPLPPAPVAPAVIVTPAAPAAIQPPPAIGAPLPPPRPPTASAAAPIVVRPSLPASSPPAPAVKPPPVQMAAPPQPPQTPRPTVVATPAPVAATPPPAPLRRERLSIPQTRRFETPGAAPLTGATLAPAPAFVPAPSRTLPPPASVPGSPTQPSVAAPVSRPAPIASSPIASAPITSSPVAPTRVATPSVGQTAPVLRFASIEPGREALALQTGSRLCVQSRNGLGAATETGGRAAVLGPCGLGAEPVILADGVLYVGAARRHIVSVIRAPERGCRLVDTLSRLRRTLIGVCTEAYADSATPEEDTLTPGWARIAAKVSTAGPAFAPGALVMVLPVGPDAPASPTWSFAPSTGQLQVLGADQCIGLPPGDDTAGAPLMLRTCGQAARLAFQPR